MMLSALSLLAGFVTATPAENAVASAQAKAAKEGKNVLVRFTASWCPWCKRFETLLADPNFAKPFQDSYVILPITVRERGDLKALENPGWEKTMRRFRQSAEQDVPYLVIVSPKGEKLGDSYRPAGDKIPGNAGYPRTPQEIEGFLDLIRRTGKAFSAEDRVALKRYFQGV